MRGYSLIEIMVSAAILIVIVTAILFVFTVAEKSWYADLGIVELQQEVRQSMDGMSRELRQAESDISKPLVISGDGSSIQFYINGYGDPINYYLNGTELVREHPQNTVKVLANNISNLTFCCVHDNICDTDCSNFKVVRVQLRAGRTIKGRSLVFPPDGPLFQQVRLRNE